MDLRELCELLNIDKNAPVFYNTKLAKKNLLQCVFVTPEEQCTALEYDAETWPSEQGIHIPVLDINVFYEKMFSSNPYRIENILNMLNMINSKIIYNKDKKQLIFACFCLFHEQKHWIDFQKSGLTGKEFMIRDFKDRNRVELLANKIISMNDDSPEKHKLAKIHAFEYGNIPLEYNADKYAISRLKLIFSI